MRRIDPSLAGTKKACALGSYVRKKLFPREDWFVSIDGIKPQIAAARARLGREEDDGTSLITVLSHMFEKDPELLDHVINDTNHDISGNENAWRDVCMAAAWTVVQEYDKAVEAGKWPIQ